MWSQQWNNIYDEVTPFKGKASVDVTEALKEQVSYPTHIVFILLLLIYAQLQQYLKFSKCFITERFLQY